MMETTRLLLTGTWLLFLAGCHPEFIRHQHVQGHGYCVSSIISSTPGAPMKVGETLCRFCKKLTFPPDPSECPNKTTFTTDAQKFQYDAVGVGDVLGCTACPESVI